MLTTEHLEQILTTIPSRTIGLIGDLFLDRYLDIDPTRDEPSVETELTAYQVTQVRAYPGALGTVLNNLVALGVGRLYPISIIGDDGEGYELRQCLAKMPGVDTSGIVMTGDRRTPTYTKPMYGSRELNRLDIKNRMPTPMGLENTVLAVLEEAFHQFDALLILDQVSEENCGVVTTRVRDRIAELGEEFPEKFILADSRERIAQFRNVCIKPNHRELLGVPAQQNTEFHWLQYGYSRPNFNRWSYVTAGENGIALCSPGGAVQLHIPAYPVAGPVDICGAGDSCSAGIAAAQVCDLSHEVAAAFGNLVASITIQQLGTTGTATPQQVRDRWAEWNRPPNEFALVPAYHD
jgi:bifunctional ADP-heptose synthase (sugar kinase/adenylyltransferase)